MGLGWDPGTIIISITHNLTQMIHGLHLTTALWTTNEGGCASCQLGGDKRQTCLPAPLCHADYPPSSQNQLCE